MSWRIHCFGGKTLQNNWHKCVENIKVPIKSITNYILNYIKLLRMPKVFKHPTNFEPRNSPFKASIKAVFTVSVEGWDSVALRQAISRRSMHAFGHRHSFIQACLCLCGSFFLSRYLWNHLK